MEIICGGQRAGKNVRAAKHVDYLIYAMSRDPKVKKFLICSHAHGDRLIEKTDCEVLDA